ncbi:hypothetical protein ACQ4PT_044019 [Festuca glaucescens]
MGGGGDRLSGLSDDLLASVISLLPSREAVRTAALSRRWRPVWLRAHSLILDSRSYGDHSEDIWAYFGRQDDGTQDRLFSNACDFLDAAGRCSHVRNLSLTVHGRNKEYFQDVMGWSCRDSYDLVASILGASALRHLEEVRAKFEVVPSPPHCERDKKLYDWVYKLDPAQLPEEHTLRLLDLDNCRLESPPDSASPSPASPLCGSTNPNLERVDLTIRRFYDETGYPAKTWFAPFWQLLRNFRHVKAIKLKVPNIEGIAVGKDVRHEHLFTFPDLKG